jgi:predicted GTPase
MALFLDMKQKSISLYMYLTLPVLEAEKQTKYQLIKTWNKFIEMLTNMLEVFSFDVLLLNDISTSNKTMRWQRRKQHTELMATIHHAALQISTRRCVL